MLHFRMICNIFFTPRVSGRWPMFPGAGEPLGRPRVGLLEVCSGLFLNSTYYSDESSYSIMAVMSGFT